MSLFRSVFPTCVGVFRMVSRKREKEESLPHVRGGVSVSIEGRERPHPSSPRAWGCFVCLLQRWVSGTVFPTCVGVFLQKWRKENDNPSLPHVRGGVSPVLDSGHGWLESSPRAWGCFSFAGSAWGTVTVFPTCVGVFLAIENSDFSKFRLPHVRGGVSFFRSSIADFVRSSPRAWGCFHRRDGVEDAENVFPTCVGVFPSSIRKNFPRKGLPHVRGGVSSCFVWHSCFVWSSPRAWGCFSMSAHPV